MDSAVATSPDSGTSAGKISSLAGSDIYVVAVHGIGDQFQNATIQSVVAAFGGFFNYPTGIPLGAFRSPRPPIQPFKVRRPSTLDSLPVPPDLARIGFVEIYWADIPREQQKAGYIIEETKAWGRTVVARLRARYQEFTTAKSINNLTGLTKDEPPPELTPNDYRSAADSIEEMIETFATLGNLLWLAEKAGILKFNLDDLLTAYVGDVQIMADFGDFRTNILDRFGSVLDQIGSQLKTENKTPDNAEIYIVAHSEGTVVAFMGLLRAMCEGGTPPPWFKYVRGFMTFGSPIDKHIVLWPDIWQPITNPHPDVTNYFAGAPGKSIRWRNYFDFGDPVGFALDTARDWLETHGWREVFAFPPTNDHGFARYALPGQAHNDYWKDPDVFGHFVENTMNLRSGEPRFANPPGSRPMAQIIANVTPYLLVYGLCCLGSYFVYNATGNYLRIRASSAASSILDVLGIGALLTGTIALARIPKLTRRSYFWPISMSIFALCAVPYFFIRAEVQHWHAFRFFADTPHGSAFFVIAVAFVVGLISARIGRSSWNRGWKVNFRWLCAGARPLVIAATAYVALIVIYRIRSGIPAQTSSGEPPPTRPLILAGGAFLYLWWLAILIFDLVFVWHRYIRFAAAPKILRAMRNARKIAEARE